MNVYAQTCSILKMLLLMLVCVPRGYSAEAENGQVAWSFLQLSFAAPLQLVSRSSDVHGVRLNLIYGDNHDVGYIDVGLINRTSGDETGLQVGVVLNRVEGSLAGLQFACINSVSKNGMVDGGQIALFNTAGDLSGMQSGLVNHARTVQGLQVGLANFAEELSGLQIGLLNFHDRGSIRVMPLINFGF